MLRLIQLITMFFLTSYIIWMKFQAHLFYVFLTLGGQSTVDIASYISLSKELVYDILDDVL